MVSSLECSCGLRDFTEHVGFLQGEMLLSQRLASTIVYRLHMPSPEEGTVGVLRSFSVT